MSIYFCKFPPGNPKNRTSASFSAFPLDTRRPCKSCGYTAPAGVDVCPRCNGEMYQRDDDKPETIRHRLDVYESQTAPLVEYYKGHSILKEVNGDRPVDEVYADVKALLAL